MTKNNLVPYGRADLFVAPLLDNLFYAFNPLGNAGVVILDEASQQLFDGFQRPSTIPAALNSLNNPPGAAAAIRKLIDLQLLIPAGCQPAIQSGPPQTLTAWLHVTNACNLRCPYCYLHKTPEQMELAHGRLAIDAIFRSAINNHFRRVKMKYAGGEATLNMKTVVVLHQYAHELAEKHNLELDGVVLSNGVSFGPHIINIFRESGLRLMISLDGVGAVHDSQRPLRNGGGSFARIERNLQNLQTTGILPTISVTITNRNLPGLAETVRYLLERQLPFSLNFYRENDCAGSFTDLAYSDQEIIATMQAAFAVIEESLPPYSLLGSILDRTHLDTPHERPCGVGQNYLVIDQNGQIAKCHMEIERSIANIQVADPLALLQADTIHLQNPSVDEKEGCRDCAWRYWCAGGCPALTYRITGRYDVKSPNCHIYQALFPAVLRLEALRILEHNRKSLVSDVDD
ncbi:MAG: radical SAM protein [Anaerolineales bacterium]|nr:radical SAM protein [Anaerolineales bacterium]